VGEVLEELKTRVRHKALIVNRMTGELNDPQKQAVEESGSDKVFYLPNDEEIKKMDENGGTVKDISEESGIYRGISSIMGKLFE
jgi:CO dehydrogenase nickel-insertion accessory protein CooC1